MLPLDPPSTLPSLVFLSVKRLGNKAYYHKLFVRGRYDLCQFFERPAKKGSTPKYRIADAPPLLVGSKDMEDKGEDHPAKEEEDASASSMMQLKMQTTQDGAFHGQPFSIPPYPEAALQNSAMMLGANAASCMNIPLLAHHHAGNWSPLAVPPVCQHCINAHMVSCGCHQFVPCFPHGFAHQVCPNLGQGLQYHHAGALQVDSHQVCPNLGQGLQYHNTSVLQVDSHQYSPNLGQGLQYHHTGSLQVDATYRESVLQEMNHNYNLAAVLSAASHNSKEHEDNSNAHETLTVTYKEETSVESGKIGGSEAEGIPSIVVVASSLKTEEHKGNSKTGETMQVAGQEETSVVSDENNEGVGFEGEDIQSILESLTTEVEPGTEGTQFITGDSSLDEVLQEIIQKDGQERGVSPLLTGTSITGSIFDTDWQTQSDLWLMS